MGNLKVDPTDADAKRMRLRRNKTLKITAKTLEEASKLAGKSQNKPVRLENCLSARTDIVVVPPSLSKSTEIPKTKPTSAAKPKGSNFALPTEKTPQRALKYKPVDLVLKPTSIPKARRIKEQGARSKLAQIPPYDGQPRFEGGFRFFQGGLPELGKRR